MSEQRTVVVTHGAWSAGWVWRKMRPRLAVHGIELWAPTYTGVGERSHLAHEGITLDDHIDDVMAVLHHEDLRNVTILAHSYGGMVGTGVCDRAADRIDGIIYLDAFVPEDGQSILDLAGPDAAASLRARAEAGDGWRVAPNPTPDDTSDEDVAWISARRGDHPLGCFTQPIRLANDTSHIRRSYIYCTRAAPGDAFRPFSDRAQSDPSWRHFSIDASHNPHITCPDALTGLLLELL